ncbi:5-methylcytosine-specific restriction enzyme A [Rhodovulum sp. ES.010]|uniref:HNH endonuclease n=1 Tax=Rhodovulum sp. ES.010 TaxID=1882821 RepID=UPI000929CEF2|nr:HNH endonuclease signature motif containing protein [Rhodovulum sp. ES.010]SIO36660.1 5-methylcytosine-specific restriction enzyme A [Rhodovulum sp. ES.010]
MTIRKLCRAPGCDELALPGGALCDEHAAERAARARARKARAKDSAVARKGAALYKTAAWRRARETYLRRHPLCVDCGDLGLVVEAEEVDHVEPHRGDVRKFWDRSNWQALCKRCHSRKTAREVFHGDRGVSQNP